MSKSVDEPFPESQIPSPLNEEDFPKSQIPSPLEVDDIFKDVESSAAQLSALPRSSEPCEQRVTDVVTESLPQKPIVEGEIKRGPLSVCVVDGLYSIHSPKGNKVLVGVELSPREKFLADSISNAKDTKAISYSPTKKKDVKPLDSKDKKKLVQSAQKIKEPIPSPRESKSLKKAESDKPPVCRVRRGSGDRDDSSKVPKEQSRVHKTSRISVSPRSEETCPLKTEDKRSISPPETHPAQSAQLEHKVAKTISVQLQSGSAPKAVPADERKIPVTTQIKRTYSFERDYDQDPTTADAPKSAKDEVHEERLLTAGSVPRVMSFECTCDNTFDDTSPEPECTCISSQEVTEIPQSSQELSRQTSSFKTAEIRQVVSPPTDSSSYHTNQELATNLEFLNTESIFSSEEEFKSGATSPFYSPRADSPEMTVSKHSSKMDKEVSTNNYQRPIIFFRDV